MPTGNFEINPQTCLSKRSECLLVLDPTILAIALPQLPDPIIVTLRVSDMVDTKGKYGVNNT